MRVDEPELTRTLRHKGSKRVPPEGLRFYSELFAFEQLFFEQRGRQGFFIRLRVVVVDEYKGFLREPPEWVLDKKYLGI